MRRTLLAASALAVGVLVWPVVTSAMFNSALHWPSAPSLTNPAPAYYYWRDYKQVAAVKRWLPPCAAGSGLLCLLPAALIAFARPSRRLREARAGETLPKPRRAFSTIHGSADWLSMNAAREMFSGPNPAYGGLVVGEAYRVDQDAVAGKRFLPDDASTWGVGGKAPLLIDPCHTGSTHGTIIAGSGGLKTVSVTVPALLHWTGSAVVFDPPNQVDPITRNARRAMGHEVFNIAPGRQGINILSWIDPTCATAEADVLDVLNWVGGDLASKAKGDGAAFAQSGRKLMAAILADMLWDTELPAERKTMREFRARLTVPERKMQSRLQDIANESKSPMARDYARSMSDLYDKTFSGAYFHATGETDFLAIEAYADMLSNRDCDPDIITQRRATIYLGIPMKDLAAAPALGRVVIATLQSALRRAEGQVMTKRVLFLLDECRFLGRLSTLEAMMVADRKYGATIVTIWQDEGDLKRVWGDNAAIFSANSSWTGYAAVKDLATAEHVSKLCGKYTAIGSTVGQGSSSSSGKGGGGRNRNQGMSEQARELIRLEDVLTMRADEIILFANGVPPIRCGRAVYFRRDEMQSRVNEDRLRAVSQQENAA